MAYKEPKEKLVHGSIQPYRGAYKAGQDSFRAPYDSGVNIRNRGAQEADPTRMQYRNLSSVVDRPTNPYTIENTTDATDDKFRGMRQRGRIK